MVNEIRLQKRMTRIEPEALIITEDSKLDLGGSD
jgi:hypothetical protein